MARDERYRHLINSTAWRALRNATLADRPFCEDCAAKGLIVPATEVHHATPVETGRTLEEMTRLAYSPSNLAALCHGCHRERHLELKKGSREANRERHRSRAEAFAEKFLRPADPGG